MVAVNFYRFASAIMELLEPKSQTQDLSVDPESISTVENANSDFVMQAKNIAQQAEIATFIAPQTTEAEAKTVETVAANLTQILANASDEKLAQVAEVIKQVAVETTPAIATQPTVLTETIEQAKTVTNADEAAKVVQATVNALAAQAVEEIKAPEIGTNSSSEAQANAVVTAVLTDKIQQKTAESISKPDTEISEPISTEPEDFWLKYDEIDPSKIKYYGTVSYLYDYMTDHSMLDYLDPKYDLSERLTSMTRVMGMANQTYNRESDSDLNIQRDSVAHLDQIRENEQDLREEDARRQEQLQLQQRIEREKMAERIAAERLKDSI